uniref:Uncharacterized protein n=1 Tax=Setaria viridis TaxID=4556 RepID=A0A4U6VWE3_SETVI|nr:hypothetical protein SEVIR_2G213800v2 [Setaria viridis]
MQGAHGRGEPKKMSRANWKSHKKGRKRRDRAAQAQRRCGEMSRASTSSSTGRARAPLILRRRGKRTVNPPAGGWPTHPLGEARTRARLPRSRARRGSAGGGPTKKLQRVVPTVPSSETAGMNAMPYRDARPLLGSPSTDDGQQTSSRQVQRRQPVPARPAALCRDRSPTVPCHRRGNPHVADSDRGKGTDVPSAASSIEGLRKLDRNPRRSGAIDGPAARVPGASVRPAAGRGVALNARGAARSPVPGPRRCRPSRQPSCARDVRDAACVLSPGPPRQRSDR